MTWREERDALIAQTIAFVESVTGKPPDFAQFASLSEQSPQLPQSSVVPQANLGTPAQPIVAMVASSVDGDKTPEAETAGTGFPSSGVDSAGFGSCNSEPRGSEPATPQTPKTEFASELFRKQPSIAAQLDWRRDMQTEIRARIASFRAHQERFNHERQEYFSTTLARLRASAPKVPRTDD